MVFSPAALFPHSHPQPLGPWLASLAGSCGPERWGQEASGLLAFEAQPLTAELGGPLLPVPHEKMSLVFCDLLLARRRVNQNCTKPQPLSPELSVWGTEHVCVWVSVTG